MIMDFIAASQDLRDSEPGDQKRPNPPHCYLFIYPPQHRGGLGPWPGPNPNMRDSWFNINLQTSITLQVRQLGAPDHPHRATKNKLPMRCPNLRQVTARFKIPYRFTVHVYTGERQGVRKRDVGALCEQSCTVQYKHYKHLWEESFDPRRATKFKLSKSIPFQAGNNIFYFGKSKYCFKNFKFR